MDNSYEVYSKKRLLYSFHIYLQYIITITSSVYLIQSVVCGIYSNKYVYNYYLSGTWVSCSNAPGVIIILTVPWFGLHCVVVAFPGCFHFLGCVDYHVFSNDDPRLTLTYNMTWSFPNAFKCVIFQCHYTYLIGKI